jgi:hypothetical protein
VWQRVTLALGVAACAAAVGAGAGGHAGPAGRLTYIAWIERGAGTTGYLKSPVTLCEANGDGTAATRLSPRIGSFALPAWTRDGSRIAFASGAALMVSPASPWSPRQLAPRGTWPAWAPDGARIAYVGTGGIAVAAADGTGPKLVAGGQVSAPSWSADGAQIAFSRAGVAGSAGVFVVPVAGGAEKKLNDDGQLPAWAPDGKRLAFVAEQELYVMNADGSGRVKLSQFAADKPPNAISRIVVDRPAWSPDSSTISVVRTVVVEVFHLPGGFVEKRNLFLFDVAGGGQVDASPAGAFATTAWRPGPAISPAEGVAKPCEIIGSGGTLRGTAFDDLIHGSDKVETIRAGAGNDWVHAEDGADVVDGGPGRDDLWSGPGKDNVRAHDGARDIVHCGNGARDTVHADRADVLSGVCRRVSP